MGQRHYYWSKFCTRQIKIESFNQFLQISQILFIQATHFARNPKLFHKCSNLDTKGVPSQELLLDGNHLIADLVFSRGTCPNEF